MGRRVARDVAYDRGVPTEAAFRHAVLDPHVRRRRVTVYGRGVYIDVIELERALREREVQLPPGELDRYVASIGGHRLERGRLRSALGLGGRRRPLYFLPELAFQRVRQTPAPARGRSRPGL